jgi:hypothetical protein
MVLHTFYGCLLCLLLRSHCVCFCVLGTACLHVKLCLPVSRLCDIYRPLFVALVRDDDCGTQTAPCLVGRRTTGHHHHLCRKLSGESSLQGTCHHTRTLSCSLAQLFSSFWRIDSLTGAIEPLSICKPLLCSRLSTS